MLYYNSSWSHTCSDQGQPCQIRSQHPRLPPEFSESRTVPLQGKIFNHSICIVVGANKEHLGTCGRHSMLHRSLHQGDAETVVHRADDHIHAARTRTGVQRDRIMGTRLDKEGTCHTSVKDN